MAHERLVVGGGCFWCVEAIYKDLLGVESVVSGYAGGNVPNPTYRQVCDGQTGHAEVVEVTYDPEFLSREELLRLFFVTHDPTTLNRQGGDYGTQYRSVIFYANAEEKAVAEKVMQQISEEKIWPNPLVTTLEPLHEFYPAEDYHQDYFTRYESAGPVERMGMNASYCAAVIEPKVAKFRKEYSGKLRRKS